MQWSNLKSWPFVLSLIVCILSICLIWTNMKLARSLTPDEMSIPFSNISGLYEEMTKGSLKKRFNSSFISETTWTIPNTLHFIWVGPLIREKYVESINNFSLHNPEYKVILWTDQMTQQNTSGKFRADVETRDVHEVIPRMINSDIVLKLKNVGAVSDLMRYELVHMFGGVYMDTDSISAAPIRQSLRYSFVSHTIDHFKNISNGIFGFPKGSRFLEFVLSAAREHFLSPEFPRLPVWRQFGPTFFTTAFVQYKDPNIRMIGCYYLVRKSKMSIIYQTKDASWIGRNVDVSQGKTSR